MISFSIGTRRHGFRLVRCKKSAGTPTDLALQAGYAMGFGVGSQLTYQIYSGIGKGLRKKYSLLLGYRYMFVDYKNGGFLYDIHMDGLLMDFNVASNKAMERHCNANQKIPSRKARRPTQGSGRVNLA